MMGSFHIAQQLRRLCKSSSGNTIIEFAIIAPTMMIVIMGIGDVLYQSYVQSILTGAVQKAGRDSAIQGGAQQTSTIDAKVSAIVGTIAKNATYSSTRLSYASYASTAPEPFVDTNNNGIRDPGECYTDVNANGQWDSNPSVSGQGGASDTTIYTMTMVYPRLFPVAGLIGMSSTQTLSAKTLLKNQPYASQTVTAPATICT